MIDSCTGEDLELEGGSDIYINVLARTGWCRCGCGQVHLFEAYSNQDCQQALPAEQQYRSSSLAQEPVSLVCPGSMEGGRCEELSLSC